MPRPGSAFKDQKAPSLDYFIRLAQGLQDIRASHGLKVDFDDYRRCGNHPNSDLARLAIRSSSMTVVLTPEIIALLDDDNTHKILATVDGDGVPHAVEKRSLHHGGDGDHPLSGTSGDLDHQPQPGAQHLVRWRRSPSR